MTKKSKVVVHPPSEDRLSPLADGQLDLEDAIVRAGWDERDPGVGVAVIDGLGREIGNPDRFEEPADISPEQDMMAVLERRITERLLKQAGISVGGDLEETPEEQNDFEVSDDIHFVSGYEVEMATEFPSMPAPPPRPAEEAQLELQKAEKELADLTARVEAARAAAKPKEPEPAASEGA